MRTAGERPVALTVRPLVGVVLTRDASDTVAAAVRSVAAVADEVIVVDSESIDDTVALAEQAGAIVLTRPFTTFPEQRNWATDRVLERHGDAMVVSVDADEWIDSELQAALRDRARAGWESDFYTVRLRINFDGRPLRFGGYGRTRLTRVFLASRGRYEARIVNEHLAVPEADRVVELPGRLEHSDVSDWSAYIRKHDRYSTLEAGARLALASGAQSVTWREARSDRSLRRRWLRERVFNRLPAKPVVRFTQTYVIGLGFLDGRAGLERSVFDAWQEMCIDLKTREAESC